MGASEDRGAPATDVNGADETKTMTTILAVRLKVLAAAAGRTAWEPAFKGGSRPHCHSGHDYAEERRLLDVKKLNFILCRKCFLDKKGKIKKNS